MKPDTPSATARLIAAASVLLSRTPADTALIPAGAAEWCRAFLARRRSGRWLLRSLDFGVLRAGWRGLAGLIQPGILQHYALRKRWIELQVRRQIAAGCQRLIVLGAGFDTLALRLALEYPGLEFIELDHPATQADKRAALSGVPAAANLQLMPLDLGDGALPVALHHSRARTTVVAEGVLMYLQAAAVSKLFAGLQTFRARHLQLLFSFMNQWPEGSNGFRPRSRLVEHWLHTRAEPFCWALPAEKLPSFLSAQDFVLHELCRTQDLPRQLAPEREASQLEGEDLVSCCRQADVIMR